MEGVSKGPWALTRHIMHWEEAYRMGTTNQDGPSEPHINLLMPGVIPNYDHLTFHSLIFRLVVVFLSRS